MRKSNDAFCLLAGLLLASILLSSRVVNAQTGDCTARVTVEQTSRSSDAYGATFKYRIHATSDALKAVVHFKLRRTFDVNGSHYAQAEPWSVTVQGGRGDDDGELRESLSPRQIAWSVEDVFCRKSSDTTQEGDTKSPGFSETSEAESLNARFLGSWSGPDHVNYSRPRGQTFDGTYFLDVREKTGPATFRGVSRLVGVYKASPGHRFDDDSTTAPVNEVWDVTITVQGSSVIVAADDSQGGTLNFVFDGKTLVENGSPEDSGGERRIRITKR